jgi:hypothetical protein
MRESRGVPCTTPTRLLPGLDLAVGTASLAVAGMDPAAPNFAECDPAMMFDPPCWLKEGKVTTGDQPRPRYTSEAGFLQLPLYETTPYSRQVGWASHARNFHASFDPGSSC